MYRAFTRPPERFGLVLVAILIAAIFQLGAPDSELTRLIAIVLQTIVLVLALFAAGAKRSLVTLAAGFGLLFCVATAIVLLGIGNVNPELPRVATLALVLLTPVVVGIGLHRELRRDRGRVRFQTIFAGLCLYLLLGLAGAFVFAVIQDLANDPFFAGPISGSPNDFLYYSFTTLTTTGYGDLTAVSNLGRAASVTEALLGQIYLVTVIAVLVGNLSRQAQR